MIVKYSLFISKLFLLLLLYTLACKHTNSPPPELRSAVTDSTVTMANKDFVQLPDNLDTLEIPFNFFNYKKIVISPKDSILDSIEVLKTLFPGIYFKDYQDFKDQNLVIWSCKTCPKLRYESGLKTSEGFLYDALPHAFLNYTQCIGSFPYTELGEKKHVFFFNTSQGFPGSGRFQYGALGAAIFEENKATWVLQTFSPVVCGEGRFNVAESPDTVLQVAGRTFFELQGGYAEGAGSTYIYSGEHLFALHKGYVQRLFYDVYAHCKSYDPRLMHWKSQVQFEPSAGGNLPDIVLLTKGHFELNDDELEISFWQQIPWWPGLREYLGANVPADFLMTRKFHFDGKSYKMIHCSYSKM